MSATRVTRQSGICTAIADAPLAVFQCLELRCFDLGIHFVPLRKLNSEVDLVLLGSNLNEVVRLTMFRQANVELVVLQF